MKPFQIGFIGVGGMGQYHISQIKKTGMANIVAISDVNSAALEKVGSELDIPVQNRYTDFLQLIENPNVHAVVSVTPNNVHAEVMKACLVAKKPFMGEKPFTRTLEEAVQLAELYKQNPVRCMIGFSYRYTPAFRYAKKLIETGKLGPIHHISLQYLQGWGAIQYQTPFVWRFDKDITGTGTLGDLGAHMIDMARYLVGELDEVFGQLNTIVPTRNHPETGQPVQVEVDDFASFQARFANGVMGVFQTTRNAIGSDNQHEASIYGTYGTLHASTVTPDELIWIHEDADTKQIVKKVMRVPDAYKVSQWSDFFAMLEGEDRPGLPGFVDGFINQVALEAVATSNQLKRSVTLHEINSIQF